MPAQSIAQQQAMGAAHAAQQGKIRLRPGSPSANIAKSMNPGDVKDFASTPHAGLPNQAENFKFYTVMTPQSHEDNYQDLVQCHNPFSFAQAGHQPEQVHSFHLEEDAAKECSYGMVKELYEQACALEEKKEKVSLALQKKMDQLHKEAQAAMNEARKDPENSGAHRDRSSALLAQIKELEQKHKVVSGSKRELKPLEEMESKKKPAKKDDKKEEKEEKKEDKKK